MYTLLIADDEPLERQMLQCIIKGKCPNIRIAGEVGDGKSAVQIAAIEKPDIILMDIRMPRMDGLEAAKHIHIVLPETMIIIITAFDEFRYAKQALSIGVAEYLLKPVRPDDIIRTLQIVIDKIHVLKEKLQEQSHLRRSVAEVDPFIKISFADIENFKYPFHYERTVIDKVRCGERKQARALLSELLKGIFASKASLDVVKACVLELLIVLSRAAIEGGANVQQLTLLNGNYLLDLNECVTNTQIEIWMLESLDLFMDNMLSNRTSMNLRVINTACDYIVKNYYKNISLEEVAQSVHLSTFYFSRLFKQEKGCNFVDFLTKVRIDKAKKMLQNQEFTAVRIAAEVGYQDASYFSRVFRQIVGMTPNQYRNEIYSKSN